MTNRRYFSSIFIILLLLGTFIWFLSFSKIRINIDDKTIEYWTRGKTVEAVLKELNLPLKQNDIVYPSLNTSMTDINQIDIKRGHKVTLEVDGQIENIVTPAENVKEILTLKNITINSLDIIQPDLATKVRDGLIIKVIRVKEKTVKVQEEIPFVKEYKEDNKLWKGQFKVLKEGKKGLISKTYLVKYHNNKEVSKELIEETILREPVTEIIARGIKQTVQRAGKNLDVMKILIMKSTAYTHTGNKTYTNVWPKRGTVAVDPNVIPLGTKLYIDGYGYAIAEDIGSVIKGNRIDLFMDTKNEALKWGQRTVRVFVLK